MFMFMSIVWGSVKFLEGQKGFTKEYKLGKLRHRLSVMKITVV